MHKALKIMTLCALVATVSNVVRAIPQPALAPKSWELSFRFQDPKRVSVLLPGKDKPVVYWYMLYEVENGTEIEVDFYPAFELVTDTLKVAHSEAKVSPEAYRTVQRLAGDPLLVVPEKAVGRLLRGKDRARHSVAIWRDFDPKARGFTVYVAGLSGEVKRLKNPVFDPGKPESEANPKEFLLRKTLAVPYRFPGSQATRAGTIPERVPQEQQWVMR